MKPEEQISEDVPQKTESDTAGLVGLGWMCFVGHHVHLSKAGA